MLRGRGSVVIPLTLGSCLELPAVQPRHFAYIFSPHCCRIQERQESSSLQILTQFTTHLLRKRGIYFSSLDHTLRLVSDHRELGYAPEQMGLNMIESAENISSGPSAFSAIAETRLDAVLWHQRFGHAGMSLLKKTQANSKGIEGISLTETRTCEPCSLAKSQRIISRRSSERATQPFGRVHIDAVGHITPELATGEKWVTVLTDDLTRHRWSRITRTKGEAYDVIEWFINLAKVHHPPFRILEVVLGLGLEFGGRQFDLLAQKESIIVKNPRITLLSRMQRLNPRTKLLSPEPGR